LRRFSIAHAENSLVPESLALGGREILIKSLRLALCIESVRARVLASRIHIVCTRALSLRRHSPQLNPMSSRGVYKFSPGFRTWRSEFYRGAF
jgi:hypothetical protein